MSAYFDDLWSWLKTAPLPVVLAINLILGGWVYSIASDQHVDQARAEGVAKQVDRIDAKMDKLLDAVSDLKAESHAYPQPTFAAPSSPRPRPYPGKEK